MTRKVVPGSPATWSVVVPVKLLARAKSRLAVAGGLREALALAMALDTVEAALATPAVGLVVVVTDDERAARDAVGAGAVVVPDVPDAGLNPALEHGAAEARRRRPEAAVAAVASDLPALRPAELDEALRSAAAHDRAVVADQDGDGSVLLAAGRSEQLRPRFGAGSLAAHRNDGAGVLDLDVPGLRRDVDTVADLAAAARIGCGPRTRALLAEVLGHQE